MKIKRFMRQTKIIVLVCFILCMLGVYLFYYYGARNRLDNEYDLLKASEPAFVKNGELAFLSKNVNDTLKIIDIEIADNEIKRAQGLMWRYSMPDSIGMLFIFDDEKLQSFWMKNTYISLDIIYINKKMEIVIIKNNTIPYSEVSVLSDKPAKFVVEVIAGFCYNYNINTGDRMVYKRTPCN